MGSPVMPREDFPNILFDFARIGEKPDGGDAGGAALQDFTEICEVDAADGQYRNPRCLANLRQVLSPERRAILALRGRIVNRAIDDKIRPPTFGGLNFSQGVCRDADQKIHPAHNSPDLRRGQGIDAQMNAVRARGQRDIEPVVDQHPCAVRAGDGNRPPHEIAQRMCAQILFANLNELAACPRGALDGFDLPIIVPVTVEECLAVGDQIEQAALREIGVRWRQVC